MATRQQLEQQLVAAHRTKNVQAAQQAAYAIRAYDQNVLSAQVPSINAPPPIDRVPKPTFGSWLGNVTAGIGEGLGEQVQGLGGAIQRGVTAFAQDPLKASAAAFMTALEPARQGFTQPVQAYKDVGTGIVETGKQMYQQATSGPIGLGQTIGQMIDLPGPSLPGGKRRPTMAELDVYHGTPHTFDPEEGAPLGRFRSEKIGTGEGAQAYGHGLYLAQSPDIAGGYAYNLGYKAGNLPTVNGKPITDLYRRIEDKAATMSSEASQIEYQKLDFLERLMQEQGTPAKVLAGLRGQEGVYPQAVEWFKKEVAPKYKGPGTTYKVDLPDSKIEQMLDWDKTFAQQSDHVKQILKESGLYKEYRANLSDFSSPMNTRNKNMRGENFLSFVENKFQSEARQKVKNGEYIADTSKYGAEKASEYLRSLGIPGIKYLDSGSRDGEKGTRNFVVFPGEEQSLTILERDGVKAEVPKAGAPKPRTAPQYNFKKESQRVSNLVNAENVTLDDYDPPKKKLNKTYAQPGQTYGSNVVENFALEREFENGTYIRVNVGADREFFGDMPDDLYDPEDPPLMYGSSIEQGGGDYDTPAPTGKGALTQMTLEALEIAKQNNGGWVSETWLSEQSVKKYERLIAAGVPFRKERNTYYILPQDLARVDLGKASDTLNKKYSGK